MIDQMKPRVRGEKHTECVQCLLQIMEGEKERLEKVPSQHLSWEVEVPYNYYGMRGYVDIVMSFLDREKTMWISLWEIKSALIDLPEILRQVHRHIEYYPKDKGIKLNNKTRLEGMLCFPDSELNMKTFHARQSLFTNPQLSVSTIHLTTKQLKSLVFMGQNKEKHIHEL